MPELPEVETIRRTLADKVVGRRIMHVDILLPRLIKWPAAGEFQAVIAGKQISELRRRGKYLLFYLEDGLVMIVHLRMTGRLYYAAAALRHDQFTRIVFMLDNGDKLLYLDSRTLGTLYVMNEKELWRISGLSTMGPEPLTTEFSSDYFRKILQNRSSKIKAVLLNQQYVGGLGNIYVDESLAIAGIDPERSAKSLTDSEIAGLYDAINLVIDEGITHGGTTFRDYRDGAGQKGEHQNHLRVYGRKDQPCTRCGTMIACKKVAGRGTHYCPQCQK